MHTQHADVTWPPRGERSRSICMWANERLQTRGALLKQRCDTYSRRCANRARAAREPPWFAVVPLLPYWALVAVRVDTAGNDAQSDAAIPGAERGDGVRGTCRAYRVLVQRAGAGRTNGVAAVRTEIAERNAGDRPPFGSCADGRSALAKHWIPEDSRTACCGHPVRVERPRVRSDAALPFADVGRSDYAGLASAGAERSDYVQQASSVRFTS